MTYTQKARKNIDAHIATTKGVTKAPGKAKGKKEAAWSELKAFELLVNAAKL